MDRTQILAMEPYILLSWVNTELRDDVDSMEELCSMYDIEPEELVQKLAQTEVSYDRDKGQFTAAEAFVYSTLDGLGLSYEVKKHAAVYTVEDADKLNLNLPGVPCKNLFLSDRKNREYLLVVVEDNKHIDLKRLSEQLGIKGLHFASEEQLAKQLGLKRGAVGPFGLLNNYHKNVKLVIDEELKTSGHVSFHPNVNTATVILSWKDFYEYAMWCDNEVIFEEL